MSRFLPPVAGTALIGSLILSPPHPLHAQLLIDAGGPRDAFYTSGGTADGLDGLHAKLNTGAKGVDLTYLGKPVTWLGISGVMLGATLKASAIDGLSEFFRFERWPQTELSLIANKTWTHDIDATHAWAWSLTTRVDGGYADYAVFDPNRPLGQEFRKSSAAQGEISETVSVAIPWIPAGVGLSVGLREGSNYRDLPSTTVGMLQASFPGSGGSTMAAVSGGEAARFGSLNHFQEYPVSLLYNHAFEGVNGFIQHLPFTESGTTYTLLVSPYGTLTPRSEGRPEHAIGLSLVIRSFKAAEDAAHPEKTVISFPVGLYVERRNPFSGRPDTTVGAAVIYHFK